MAEITITNKMTSRYNLRGKRDVNLRFEMMVGNYKNSYMPFEIRAKARKSDTMPFEIEVKYGGTSNLGFEIIPRINKHLPFEIEVAPHNTMYARYELIEPPIKKWDATPVQDSYVLTDPPYSSINYGGNNSLVIGKSSRGNGIPFVQFDLSTLEPNVRIKSAKFRLYYNDYSNMDIELRKVNEPWREKNITYLNAPKDSTFITNEYGNNPTDRYIEFDVTDTVASWVLGIPNNGFCLHSDDPATMAFRSRETSSPPRLLIDYISNDPINSSRSRMKFSITPKLDDISKLPFEVEVISYFKHSTLGFSIFAHDPNHVYDSKMGFSINASRDKLGFELFVMKKEHSNMRFEIAVAETKITTLPFEVFVPSFDGSKVIPFEIIARREEKSTLGFIIDANRDYKTKTKVLPFEVFSQGIYKLRTIDLGFEITVQRVMKSGTSELPFEITPRLAEKSVLPFEIEALTDYTRDYKSLPIEISVRGHGKNNLPFTINVSRDRIGFGIQVYDHGSSSIGFEVSARKLTISELGFLIAAGKSSRLPFEIEVAQVIYSSGSHIYIV